MLRLRCGLLAGPMRAGRPCAAVSAPSASDERCDSRSPHRRRWRRMRCQLWPMRWDCRSVRQAMQPAMNRGLFCSSARRRRLRQSARRHTDGACDSPCSLVLCAAGRRGQRDRCCRSRCATASSACLGRRGHYPASPCASKSWCDRAVPSINSSCVRLASCLRPGCLGRLHVGRFEDRRRLYSGV